MSLRATASRIRGSMRIGALSLLLAYACGGRLPGDSTAGGGGAGGGGGAAGASASTSSTTRGTSSGTTAVGVGGTFNPSGAAGASAGNVGGSAGAGGFGGSRPSGVAGSGGGSGGAAAGGGTAGKAVGPFDAGPPTSACDVNCPMGPCRVLGGLPQVLASSPFEQQIVSLAPGDHDLYYGTLSNTGSGEVRRIPLGGGTSTLLAEGVQAGDLLLDGELLYYVDTPNRPNVPSTLWALPTAGGAPRVVAADERLINVRIDASSIYFQASNAWGAGRVVRLPRGSGDASTPEVIAETIHPWGFAIDDKNVYFTKYDGGGTLLARPLAGGATTTLVMSTEPVVEPMVAGDYVYYFSGGTPGVCKGAVMRVPKTGGMVEQFSPGNTGAASSLGRIVDDDSFVYWSQALYTNDRILRAPKRGGSDGPEVVDGDGQGHQSVAVTATHVYWTAGSSSGGYEIRAVAK